MKRKTDEFLVRPFLACLPIPLPNIFLKFVKVGHYRTERSQTSVPEEGYREAS